MSFRIIPQGAQKRWTLRSVVTDTTAKTGKVIDADYESPVRELTIGVEFASEDFLRSLPYAIDDHGYDAEWEFAEESWNALLECVDSAVTNYNQTLIKRSRELSLTSVKILGEAKMSFLHPQRPAALAPTIVTLESTNGTVINGQYGTVSYDNRTTFRAPKKNKRGWVRSKPESLLTTRNAHNSA